jgi:hypothetical protein
MRVLEIIRLEETDQGTIGVLKVDKVVCCFTLEPSDQLNAKSISSIPAQQYTCKLHQSPKHGLTYMVENVPGRDWILFHAGNVVAQTEGCILLGDRVGKLKGNRAVLNSGDTFKQFMETMNGAERIHLTIQEKY